MDVLTIQNNAMLHVEQLLLENKMLADKNQELQEVIEDLQCEALSLRLCLEQAVNDKRG